MVKIPDKLYFKIGEVSKITGVKPYVLRYWESEFKIVRPQKSTSKQRVYTKKDVEQILEIKNLLYNEKFTLEGAKKQLKSPAGRRHNQDRPFAAPNSDQKSMSTLKNIKEELYSIKKILQTGA